MQIWRSTQLLKEKIMNILKKSGSLTAFLLILLASGCDQHEQLPRLKDTFKDLFYIGTALNYNQIMGKDKPSLNLVREQFNSITAENVQKWEQIHPEPGVYHFEPADSFTAFGERNHMYIVGHTLIWKNQTPSWVFLDSDGEPASRDTLLARMRDHIMTVVGRYRGRIQGWDVINEAFEDDGSLRASGWLDIIGADYIEKAFAWAHEADPDAKLFYNDFNMWKAGKRDAVIQLVRNLQAKNIRIDAIGMQGHWGLDYPPLDDVELAIKAYAALGVKVMISELDMDMLPLPGDYTGADITQRVELKKALDPFANGLPDSMQTVIADRYGAFFNLFCRNHESISRITFWGVHDGLSWRNNWPVPGRTAYPLLFDRKLQPHKAFFTVIKSAETASLN
jgi:endo-1,4-beta-xylanase